MPRRPFSRRACACKYRNTGRLVAPKEHLPAPSSADLPRFFGPVIAVERPRFDVRDRKPARANATSRYLASFGFGDPFIPGRLSPATYSRYFNGFRNAVFMLNDAIELPNSAVSPSGFAKNTLASVL